MPSEAQTVGGGAEDVLETRRRVAVGVQRPREPEDEADGDAIRLVGVLRVAPRRRLAGQGTLGAGEGETVNRPRDVI